MPEAGQWAEGAGAPGAYVDRIVEHERMRRYQELGIDPLNPNPDGSDHHLMDAVDAELAKPHVWPAHLPKDSGMIGRLNNDIASIERGVAMSEWDAKRLPALKRMLATYTGQPACDVA